MLTVIRYATASLCAVFLFLSGVAAQVPMTGAGSGSPGEAAPPSPPTTCAALIALVSNIAVCLDADTGVTLSGSDVTIWTDQTSNGYAFTPGSLSSNSPLFSSTSYGGAAGISFDAGNQEALATTAAAVSMGVSASSFFMSIIFDKDASTPFARFINFVGNGQSNDFGNTASVVALFRNNTGTNISCVNNSNACTDFVITNVTATRLGIVFSGSTATPYIDNVAQTGTSLSFTLGATGAVQIGGGTGSGGAYSTMTVRRIVVMTSAASSTDRGYIDSFLSN